MLEILLRPIGYLLTMVYAPYMSFKAIQTPEPDDDKQWLTFWVVFAFFSSVEMCADFILSWVPLYYEIKFGLIVWMLFYRGAQTIYDKLVAPFLGKYEAQIDERMRSLPADARELVREMQDSEFFKRALDDPKALISKYGAEIYMNAVQMAAQMKAEENTNRTA